MGQRSGKDVGGELGVPVGGGQHGGVLVTGHQHGEGTGLLLGLTDAFGGRHLVAFAGEDVLQDLAGGVLAGVVQDAVEPVVGVVGEQFVRDNVQHRALASAAGDDVQVLPRHLWGDERVGGVDGGALRAVGGRGVQQLDVFGHVRGGQQDGSAVLQVSYGQRSVVVAGEDAPAVAVLHPVPAGVYPERACRCGG